MFDKPLFVSDKKIVLINAMKGKYYIYDRKSPIKYEINKDMVHLLEYIYNNKPSLNNVVDELQIDKSLVSKLIDKDILTFEKNLDYSPFVCKNNLERFFIQLTSKCNLACKHCFNSSGLGNIETLTKSDVIRLIDKLVNNGIYQIDFTGGEPFLFKGFEEILTYLNNKPVKTHIFTNLTILTDENISTLIKSKCLFKIITSLDFYTPSKHNTFRGGRNAFERTVRNIRKLRSNGFNNISVNVMVMKENRNEIEELINFLKYDLKVDYRLDTLIPEGRAKDRSTNINDDLIKDSSILAQVNKNKLNDKTPFNLKTDTGPDLRPMEFCGVGHRMIYVNSSGTISLCPSLTKDKSEYFTFGNIKQPNLNIEYIARELSKNFSELRCSKTNCEFYKLCSGGCRARALIYTGNIYGPDPVACAYYGKLKKGESLNV